MATRARDRAAKPDEADDRRGEFPPWLREQMADKPQQFSPEPPDYCPECLGERQAVQVHDEPVVVRYSWPLACDLDRCEHEHHKTEVWLA